MYTRYALSKCHICSRPSHYVRPQGSTVQKIFQFHSTAYFPSSQSSSSPSRPTTHHSPTSSLKILPYPHQNKKVSILSLVCPSPLSDLTISSPNLYDCIVLIIVLYYCVLFFFIIVSCFHLSLASWLLFSNKSSVQFSSNMDPQPQKPSYAPEYVFVELSNEIDLLYDYSHTLTILSER